VPPFKFEFIIDTLIVDVPASKAKFVSIPKSTNEDSPLNVSVLEPSVIARVVEAFEAFSEDKVTA
jgi:hypothetical protein